jgi:hypothetical protein
MAGYWKTRVFSFVALAGMVGGCGALGREGYFVATDSFVAPAILSPQSDLVLEQKLKFSQIELEKGRAEQSIEECNNSIEADQKAVIRLNELKDMAANALTFSKTTTGAQVNMGGAALQTLSSQAAGIRDMIDRQTSIVNDAKNNLAAGLLPRSEFDREQQSLDALRIQLMDNERSKMSAGLALNQAALTQYALSAKRNTMFTQEQMMNMDTVARIEVQIFSSEADLRTKNLQKQQMEVELVRVMQLESDLKNRPLFQAIEKQLDVAFSPYTSLKGIMPGGRLMDCVWGVFNCKEVGKVVSIISGEAILPDIFGAGQVRGQFISLDLHKNRHDEAMQSKVLRVRGEGYSLIGDVKFARK